MTSVEFTADVVRSAKFREKLRGYHPEDVHAVMERAAAAIDQLTVRLSEATERALRAETALDSNSEADESVRRTLVLAQRTAEMAVREANDEASRIKFEARTDADRLLEDSRAEATRVEADARDRATALELEAERTRAAADEHARTTVDEADAMAVARIREAEEHAAALQTAVTDEIATSRADAAADIERQSIEARQQIERAVVHLQQQRSQLWADVAQLSDYLAAERARVHELLNGSLERFGTTLTPAPLPAIAPPPEDAAMPPVAGAAGAGAAGAGAAVVEPAQDLTGSTPGPVAELDEETGGRHFAASEPGDADDADAGEWVGGQESDPAPAGWWPAEEIEDDPEGVETTEMAEWADYPVTEPTDADGADRHEVDAIDGAAAAGEITDAGEITGALDEVRSIDHVNAADEIYAADEVSAARETIAIGKTNTASEVSAVEDVDHEGVPPARWVADTAGSEWAAQPDAGAAWADQPVAEAWRWPATAEPAADSGPAHAWFGPDADRGPTERSGWSEDAWERVVSLHEPATRPSLPWDGHERDEALPVPAGASWSPPSVSGDAGGANVHTPEHSMDTVPAEAGEIEAADEIGDDPPTRLLFTLDDDPRRTEAQRDDPPMETKPRKSLLGRRRG